MNPVNIVSKLSLNKKIEMALELLAYALPIWSEEVNRSDVKKIYSLEMIGIFRLNKSIINNSISTIEKYLRADSEVALLETALEIDKMEKTFVLPDLGIRYFVLMLGNAENVFYAASHLQRFILFAQLNNTDYSADDLVQSIQYSTRALSIASIDFGNILKKYV